MDYGSIIKKYPDKYVIARVLSRDERNFVTDWEVLSANSVSFVEAIETYNHYWDEGVRGICIVNTYNTDDSKPDEASAVARMFRLQFGMDME